MLYLVTYCYVSDTWYTSDRLIMKYILLAVLKLLVNAFKSNKCTFSKFDKTHEFDFTFGPSYSFFSRAINFSFCLMFDYTHIVKTLNLLISQNNQLNEITFKIDDRNIISILIDKAKISIVNII